MADQSTNDKPEVKPGSDEYNKQMVDRLERGHGDVTDEQRDAPPIPQLPEGGSEKFYDKTTGAYDWKSHATELQFKIDQKNGKTPPEKKEGEQSDNQPEKKSGDEASDAEVVDIITKAGLTAADLAKQLTTNGKLDDSAIEALKKQGVSQEHIDNYAAGFTARTKLAQQAAYDYVGGENNWVQLHNWAVANLNDAEKSQINSLLAGPDWTVALDALGAKMKAASPTAEEGELVNTGHADRGSSTGYSSRQQMINDVQSDKYRTDAAFRAVVQKRIAVSRYEDDGI